LFLKLYALLAGCQWLKSITLAAWEAVIRRIPFQGQFRQIVHQTSISKITRAKWTLGTAHVVEPLLCKCETLNSNPPVAQKKKNPKKPNNKIIYSSQRLGIGYLFLHANYPKNLGLKKKFFYMTYFCWLRIHTGFSWVIPLGVFSLCPGCCGASHAGCLGGGDWKAGLNWLFHLSMSTQGFPM
jgi:hypothetical protein